MFPILNLGPLSIPAPEFILLLGFWLGSLLSERSAVHYQIESNQIGKLIWTCLAAGIIGGRLSYIASNPGAFWGNLISILSINPNLLDPTGGILISIVVGYFYHIKLGLPLLRLLDAITPFLVVLVGALSLSSFASGSGFGTATTLPWGTYLWGEIRHPVQLYILLGDITTLIIILTIKKLDNYWSGKTFLIFITLASGFRMFLMGFQEDTPIIAGTLRLNQIIAWMILAISLALFIRKGVSNKVEVRNEP